MEEIHLVFIKYPHLQNEYTLGKPLPGPEDPLIPHTPTHNYHYPDNLEWKWHQRSLISLCVPNYQLLEYSAI